MHSHGRRPPCRVRGLLTSQPAPAAGVPAGSRRTDIAPGIVRGTLKRVRGSLALAHDGGADRITLPLPDGVVRLLLGQDLSWELAGRNPDGSLQGRPILTGSLGQRIAKATSLERHRPARRGAARRNAMSQPSKGLRRRLVQRLYPNVARKVTNEDLDRAIRNFASPRIADHDLRLLLESYHNEQLRDAVEAALESVGDRRLGRFLLYSPGGWHRGLAGRLSRALVAYEEEQARERARRAVERPHPARGAVASDHIDRESLTAKRFVPAPPDPMRDLRRRIGPVQNYGDDT